MKAQLQWKEKMHFVANVGGYEIPMDSNPPFGDAKHPTPKQLLLTSMAGCTAMDVLSLLKKYKQNFTGLRMEINAEAVSTQPQIFTEAVFNYFAEGEVLSEKLNEAIHLSLSKYCSVNAMVSKVVSISWKSFINGQLVGEGKAEFTF